MFVSTFLGVVRYYCCCCNAYTDWFKHGKIQKNLAHTIRSIFHDEPIHGWRLCVQTYLWTCIKHTEYFVTHLIGCACVYACRMLKDVYNMSCAFVWFAFEMVSYPILYNQASVVVFFHWSTVYSLEKMTCKNFLFNFHIWHSVTVFLEFWFGFIVSFWKFY